MSGDTNKFKRVALRLVRGLLVAVVAVYVVICLAYTVFQRRIIYPAPRFHGGTSETWRLGHSGWNVGTTRPVRRLA